MKPLEITFRKDDFDYAQIDRKNGWCIYSKTKTGFRRMFYEVMRTKSHNGREIAGKKFPPAEFLPSSEEWGTSGFSFSDRETAIRFFEAKAALLPPETINKREHEYLDQEGITS